MTGPKLTAMIVFGALSFLFAFLFTIGLNSAFGAIATGAIVAGLACAFIYFAKSIKQGFARGFLALGMVFIIVPIAALAGFGDQLAETVLTVQDGIRITEDETATLMLQSAFATAGLVFGIIVGLILVLIGGLMHRPPNTPT